MVKTSPILPFDLSVVITHFKTPDILNTCLGKLVSYGQAKRIIVIDSGNDGSLDRVLIQYPEVEGYHAKNQSMANTVNAGLKLCNTKYILQMNADVFLENESIPKLLNALKKENVGMVGPIAISALGKLQQQGLLYNRHYQFLRLTRADSCSVSWLSGCCNLMKRDALEQVGGLNSSLRFYNEDLEWSWRFKKANWDCKLVNTKVIHLGGSSTPKHVNFVIEGYRGGYLLSTWYKSKIYQALHVFIIQQLSKQKMKSSDSLTHKAYTQIHSMFTKNRFHESPFGETLEATNQEFLVPQK